MSKKHIQNTDNNNNKKKGFRKFLVMCSLTACVSFKIKGAILEIAEFRHIVEFAIRNLPIYKVVLRCTQVCQLG